MAAWGWIAVGYAAYVGLMAAVGKGSGRRVSTIAAALVFGIAATGIARLEGRLAAVLLPGAVALAGYWLSGLLVGSPQPWLESRLLASDRRVFERLSLDRRLATAPRWTLELLELSYALVYGLVIAGAALMGTIGLQAVRYYWGVVLLAGFVCYAALPHLRCRPPRVIEPPGAIACRAPLLRRLNDRIVTTGSIQANTIPSGHVATALAAAFAVASWHPAAGVLLIGAAMLIALAATAGRYHYAVDCGLGALVAAGAWMVIPA